MALEKLGKLREFFLLLCGHPVTAEVISCMFIAVLHLAMLLVAWLVSDIAIFVLKRDVKLQLTNLLLGHLTGCVREDFIMHQE